jgi:hypothetical protein
LQGSDLCCRRCAVALQKIHVRFVPEEPVAALSGQLGQESELSERSDETVRGRKRTSNHTGRVIHRDHGPSEKVLQQLVPISCASAEFLLEKGLMILLEGQNSARRIGRLDRGLFDTHEEEGEPALPISVVADPLEAGDVLLTILEKVIREVQHGPADRAARGEKESDEQASHSSVPVQEGMDRLELGVDESRTNQGMWVPVILRSLFPKLSAHSSSGDDASGTMVP